MAGSDVKLSFIGLVMSGIRAVVGSTAFLIISLILAVAAIAVFAFNFLEYQKKQQSKASSSAKQQSRAGSSAKKQKISLGTKPVPSAKKASPARQAAKPSKGKGSLAAYQSRKEGQSNTQKR